MQMIFFIYLQCVLSLQLTTNKTSVLKNKFFLLFLRSEVREGIDDDTKDEVQHDNDDDEEEEQVINNPGYEKWLLQVQ